MIDREKAQALRSAGLTYEQIAAELGGTVSGAYYACNRDKQRRGWKAYDADRRANDPEYLERSRARIRFWHRKNTLGIVDATDERGSGPCEVCGREGLRLCQDHDHSTGLRRGWLCVACNRGLGYLQDSPEILRNALAYLQRKETQT